VLTPLPGDVTENRAYYEGFGAALREQSPQICIISALPKLRELASSADKPGLSMPEGHYVPQANRAIARAVVAGLETCGITP